MSISNLWKTSKPGPKLPLQTSFLGTAQTAALRQPLNSSASTSVIY